MLGVDTATFITAVAQHVIITSHRPTQDAADKAIDWHLPPHEPHLSCALGIRLDAARIRFGPLVYQVEDPRTDLPLMVFQYGL